MRYLHSMLRVQDLEKSLDFYCGKLGMVEVHRLDNEEGRFTLVFLTAPDDLATAQAEGFPMQSPCLELTYNWDPETYDNGQNFGHIAFAVDDIYAVCQKLHDQGVVINRPPRDGWMAFVKSPDGISIELLQKGGAQPAKAPWKDMENNGSW